MNTLFIALVISFSNSAVKSDTVQEMVSIYQSHENHISEECIDQINDQIELKVFAKGEELAMTRLNTARDVALALVNALADTKLMCRIELDGFSSVESAIEKRGLVRVQSEIGAINVYYTGERFGVTCENETVRSFIETRLAGF